MTFRTKLAAAALMLIVPVAAYAADVPRPHYKAPIRSVIAYYNWTGFYIGGVLGYGSGTADWDVTGFPSTSIKPKGMMYGVTLGYNFQAGSWVYGIEGDYSFSSVKGSATGCFGIVGANCEVKQDAFATARLRLGYAFDRFLPYITAGAAYSGTEATATAGGVNFNAKKGQFGWTAGAGIEYAFLGSWSAKVEYLYADFGNFNTNIAAPFISDNVKFSEQIVRVGLNYRFGGPVFSRY